MDGSLGSAMKTVLAHPGSIYIGKLEGDDAVVIAEPSAGWMVPKGIRTWESEVTVVARADLSDAVRAQLKATFPEEQIPKAKLPHAFEAASQAPFIAVSPKLTPDLIAAGVRIHTVGADKTSSGFFYFAEGGGKPAIRVQGDMLSFLAPTLTGDETTALIDQYADSLVDRMLLELSGRILSESAVELAAALPKLNTDGKGLDECDLEAFEKEAAQLAEQSKDFAKDLEELARRLHASAEGAPTDVPLFGVAKREPQFEMKAEIDGKPVTLGRRARWIVRGEPSAARSAGASPWTVPPPGAAPAVDLAKKAEEEAAAKKKAEEEAKAAEAAMAAAAKAAEEAAKAAAARAEEAARKAAEDAAKKKAEEEAAKKKAEEEAAAKAAAAKKAEEEAAAKKAEEEAAAKAAAKKAEEEAAVKAASKKAEDEAAAKVKSRDADTAPSSPSAKKSIEKSGDAPVVPTTKGPNVGLFVGIGVAVLVVLYFLLKK